MNIKTNKATPQRPAGDHPLDAPLLVLDLPALLAQIRQEPTWHTNDRTALTVFKADGLRLVLMALHAGAELKTHTAAGIISVQVLEGQIIFSTAQQTVALGQGQLLALHAGIPHSVVAAVESFFLLTLAISK